MDMLVGILRLMVTLAGIAFAAIVLGGMMGAAAATWKWLAGKLAGKMR